MRKVCVGGGVGGRMAGVVVVFQDGAVPRSLGVYIGVAFVSQDDSLYRKDM